MAYVDQGYSGDNAAEQAQEHGIELLVVKLEEAKHEEAKHEEAKHEEAKHGFVLLPKRWVVERSFAWATRFRRLAKDYERLPETVAGLHFVASPCLFPHRAIALLGSSP